MTEREACIILNLISGIGHARYQALAAACGSGAAALEASMAELAGIRGFSDILAQAVAEWRISTDWEAELRLAEQAGVRVITLADEDYPAYLREIHDPPLCLYVRGTLPDFTGRSVAIVGSRRMSAYGRRMTEAVTAQAVAAGWIVVSGLAFGVDAVSHETALRAGGLTVAVLGSGLGRVHPQEHVPLARDIVASGGALLSEYPMGFQVNRRSLPRRNRIVSALSTAVLVVEAGVDSGALITAKSGLEQGKDIFAVPGQADNPQAAGCNRLIKEGAKLTESFADVVQDLEFGRGYTEPDPEQARGVTPDLFGMTPEEQKVCAVLKLEGQQRFDALVNLTQLDAGALLGALMKLDMAGHVLALPGKIYALK